jgi:hypothetical protein
MGSCGIGWQFRRDAGILTTLWVSFVAKLLSIKFKNA